MGADGNWTNDGGTGKNSTSSVDTSSYTGTESYTDSLANSSVPKRTGSLTGAATESGTYSTSSSNSYDQTLGDDNNWTITDGNGTGTVSSNDSSSYSGTGNYSDNFAGYSASDAGRDTQTGTVPGSITASGYTGSSMTQSVSAVWDGGQWVSTGYGSNASSSDDTSHYSSSGSYTDTAAGPTSSTLTETLNDKGSSDSWSQNSYAQTLGSDASWTISSGHGTTTTTGSDTSSYSGTGPYADTLSDATVTGTTTDAGSNYSASWSTIGSTWEPQTGGPGQWSTSGSATNTATSGDASTYTASGAYHDAPADGTISGTATETGTDKSSFDQSVGQSMGNDGNWSITVGATTQTDAGGSTLSYAGLGGYSDSDSNDYGSITGDLIDTRSNAMTWGSSVGTSWSGGQWVTAGNSSGTNTTYSDLAYSGSGEYFNVNASTDITGSQGEEGDDRSSLSLGSSATLAAGAWVSTGQGTTSTSGYYGSDYEGGGAMTIATGLYSSSVGGTETETGYEDSSYSSSATETLGADSQWTLNPGGAGSSMDSIFASSSYSGSGAYSHGIVGGTASGTAVDKGWTSMSSSLNASSAVNAAGAWASSATQSMTSSNATTASYTGGGTYSRPTSTTGGGIIASGPYAESATAVSTAGYSLSTSIHPDGTSSVISGSGTASLSTDVYYSYSGSGTSSSNVNGVSASSTYSEKGAHDVTANDLTTYAESPNGAWQATNASNATYGNDSGGYSYSYQTSASAGSTSGMAAESHVYVFSGTVSLAASLGGTPTITGSITGSPVASATGTLSQSQTNSCGTSTEGSSYHFQPTWTAYPQSPDRDIYHDSGSVGWSSSSGTTTSTPTTEYFSDKRTPGFAGPPAPVDPVTGPSFGESAQFGFGGEVPPDSAPTAVPEAPATIGSSTWEAIKALAGQAEPSVQTAFNHSVSDRGLGTASAFAAVLSGGAITHVGGQPYDAANFASAQGFASGVIIVGSLLIPGAEAVDSGIASGGLARLFSGTGEGAGDGAVLGSAVNEGEGLAGQVGCFRAGTLVLTNGGRVPIERVELGQRVLTAPEGREDSRTTIHGPNYRVIHLRYVEPGTEHTMDLELLRHERLLDGLGAGDTVRLSALELELDGHATVLSVKPAPCIHAGSGRLVTGTIRGRNADVRLLKLAGLERPIEVTGSHPVFSHDRGRFVRVSELEPGERLRTRSNVAEVACVTRLCGEYLVFNLEVHEIHTYYVSELDVLVHNTCVDDALNATMSHGDQFLDGSVTNPNFTNPAGALNSDEALEAAERWLGDNYSQAAGRSPGAGAGIFRSAPDSNGMVRQFRMVSTDLAGSHGTIGSHFHLQLFDILGSEIANNHVPLI